MNYHVFGVVYFGDFLISLLSEVFYSIHFAAVRCILYEYKWNSWNRNFKKPMKNASIP